MTTASTFVLYPVLAAALYYLSSWALVTRWLWSRYPVRLAQFLGCASCAGFWWGVGLALLGGLVGDASFLGLRGDHRVTPIVVGLVTLVTTPLIARAMLHANDDLHPDPHEGYPPPDPDRDQDGF